MNRERIEDLAMLYSSGELSGQDLADFTAWRATATAEELAYFAGIVDDVTSLTLSQIKPVQPSPEVKDQLMAKLGLDKTAEPLPNFEFRTEGEENGEWEELPVKGVRIRRLSDHAEDGHTVFMLELDPNTRFPSHVHKGAECAYVLSGDLEIEGRFLRAGDFSRAAPGSTHRSLYSRDGCRALLITSRDNFPRKTMNAYTGMRKAIEKITSIFGKPGNN
jgi:quercetin dioxygenase-like cupin family protein